MAAMGLGGGFGGGGGLCFFGGARKGPGSVRGAKKNENALGVKKGGRVLGGSPHRRSPLLPLPKRKRELQRVRTWRKTGAGGKSNASSSSIKNEGSYSMYGSRLDR